MGIKIPKISKKKQRANAYQLLLWEDESLSEEKRMWLALCKLEESQDKLRKSLFREIGELKSENKTLKEQVWSLRQDQSQMDLFSDFFKVAN